MLLGADPIGEMVEKRRRSSPADRKAAAIPAVYLSLILEIERRRQAAGISMDEMSELMGSAERSYAKMLSPDTPSGRQARWETLQKAVDVLFCEGFDLVLKRIKRAPLTTEGTRRKILASAAEYNRLTQREIMAERGRKGGLARARKLSPEERTESARKAGQAKKGAILGRAPATGS